MLHFLCIADSLWRGDMRSPTPHWRLRGFVLMTTGATAPSPRLAPALVWAGAGAAGRVRRLGVPAHRGGLCGVRRGGLHAVRAARAAVVRPPPPKPVRPPRLRACMGCWRFACQAHSQLRHASGHALGHAGPGALDAGEQAAQSSQRGVHGMRHADSAVPGLGPGTTRVRCRLCCQGPAAAAPAHGTHACMQLIGLW
jgi:hypothetical protein